MDIFTSTANNTISAGLAGLQMAPQEDGMEQAIGYIHDIEGNNPDDPKDAAVGENPGPERGIRGYRFSDGIKSGLCYQATIPRPGEIHKGVEFNPESKRIQEKLY